MSHSPKTPLEMHMLGIAPETPEGELPTGRENVTQLQQSLRGDAHNSHLGVHPEPTPIWSQTRLSHRCFTTITPDPSQGKNQDHFRKPQGIHISETYQDPSCPKERHEGMARQNKCTNKGFQQQRCQSNILGK